MYSRIFFFKKRFFLLFFISSLLCGCRSNSLFTEENDYAEMELTFLSSQNESVGPETFFKDKFTAVAMEMNEFLLDNVKKLWREKNETFSINRIILGTFNSRGLQDKIIFTEASEFLRTIQGLKPSPHLQNSGPTMHVLNELLQYLPTNGSLLLLTTMKPSDEEFGEFLEESIFAKNCELSVLWAGNQQSYYFDRLKNLAIKTRGRFTLLSNKSNIDDKFNESEKLENTLKKLKFPDEEENETQAEDVPLLSRAMDQKVWQKISVPLIVEVASGANLEIRSGVPSKIPFTVKNNVNIPLRIFFRAKFNGVIQNVQPPQELLPPGVTVTVTAHLQPFSGIQTSAVGTLTLSAIDANKVTSRSALIFMASQNTNDKTEPKMYYNYKNDCSNFREPHNCENGHWGLEATIQDEDSGLLKILSEPYGLLFQSEFVAGTKSPVKVYYTATCCQPVVQIWAEDLKGNYVKKSFDVFNQTLLAGEVATIVLGVILLLFIVIAIIVAVVFIRRRNRRNMIIPRARSGSR